MLLSRLNIKTTQIGSFITVERIFVFVFHKLKTLSLRSIAIFLSNILMISKNVVTSFNSFYLLDCDTKNNIFYMLTVTSSH